MNIDCIKYINDGAYAEIWLARDELSRLVAVKAMKPSGVGVSDLMQHADVLIRAEHPNVVQVYSIETIDIPNKEGVTLFGNQDCIVMEYVQGITFDQYLSKGSLSNLSLYKTGSQILEGLIHIHSKNLVHRDLHDNNIMVSESGKVKLIDIMYIDSLSEISEQAKSSRIDYDIVRLTDVLERLIRESKLGEDGVTEFGQMISGKENLLDIKNAFYDIFTFAHERFHISGVFLKGGAILKLRHYKFKAEALIDVLEFFKNAKNAVKGYRIDNDMLSGVEVEFVSTNTKSELIDMLYRSPDCELMADTLEHIYDYTGNQP